MKRILMVYCAVCVGMFWCSATQFGQASSLSLVVLTGLTAIDEIVQDGKTK